MKDILDVKKLKTVNLNIISVKRNKKKKMTEKKLMQLKKLHIEEKQIGKM